MRCWYWPLLAGVVAAGLVGGWRAGAAPAGVRAGSAPADLRAAPATSGEGRVQLLAQAGFDRKAKLDRWAPLQVEVVNQGAALDGRLVARQARGGEPAAAYSLPLPLAEGARKRVSLTVPAQSGSRTVEVAYEVGGRAIASTTVAIDLVGAEDLLAGVISREPLALDALGQAKLAGRPGSVRLVRLAPETLPDNLSLLDNFDLLALARAPSTRLTSAQVGALAAWVRRGGLLVLVGGPDWRGTLAGLPPELVPVQPGGTRPVADLPVLAALGGRELPPRGRPIALTAAALRDARALVQDGGDPVIAVARRGQGTILYFGVDLTLEPFASWGGSAALWETLLLQYRGGGLWSPRAAASGNPAQMARAIESQPLVEAPDVRRLGLWLAIYLAALGPLGYALVRWTRRPGLIWLGTPLLALAAVGLLYWRGFVVERRQVMARSVSVTELSPGQPTADSRTYLAVFAPSRASLEFPLRNGDLAAPLRFGERVPGAEAGLVHVRAGDPPVVELAGLTMWGPRGLVVDREVEGMEAVRADLSIRGNRLVGTLTNLGPRQIRRPVLITSAGHENLPDLPPGKPVPVETSLLGFRRPWQPVFQDLFPEAAPTGTGEQREAYFRRQVLEAALGSTREALPGPVLLLGWLDEAPAPLPLREGRATGTHLVYQVVQPRVDPAEYDLPPGLVVGRLVGGEGRQRGRSPRGYFLQEGALIFSLQVPDVDREALREVNLAVETGGPPGSARVKLLNWTTGRWEEAPPPGGPPVPPRRWDAFIARDGSVLVRVEVEAEGQEVRPPTISLRGRR